VATRPKPLSDEVICKIISNALDRGPVLPSNHFRQRMRQRNFNMQDTIAVLEKRSGIKAVWNDTTDTWNYDVRGHDLDGNELTIRIAPTDDDTGIVLVTGF